ncbi:DUF547 domain-containing protein [Synoicihabitans lomoniglobus]|uniref:DUF547 domain-containing protein n=1 Tax=Synoicihabitans lomoniglobus TaxID=2909285 RepID=A0AAF0CNE4_9BACT|nr:DUF547 domain-containing protein [Opitutaceae bacterium LMO-M01]WED65403.1 DUF547 domain-containing protein [Opitutaceae bacterium LMO-M01]
MRQRLHLLPSLIVLLFGAATAVAGVNDAVYTALLQDHVRGAEVDYRRIQKDPRLDAYLAELAATDPTTLASRDAQLAFWINAYNAYTLKLIASVYPVDTIRTITAVGQTDDVDQGKPWDIPLAIVGGRAYTLEFIEHEIIRPQFNDARIHFALVCAAVSCPKLRHEAYTATDLNAQLNDQGRWFLAHRNEIDGRRRTARLSQIFNWFADDFGGNQTAILDFIADFTTADIARSLRRDPDGWKVSYLDYDWDLNDRH